MKRRFIASHQPSGLGADWSDAGRQSCARPRSFAFLWRFELADRPGSGHAHTDYACRSLRALLAQTGRRPSAPTDFVTVRPGYLASRTSDSAIPGPPSDARNFLFPPGSPDLNPQEHVWKAARSRISHNPMLRKFDVLVQPFENYLQANTFPCSLLELHAYQAICALFICVIY